MGAAGLGGYALGGWAKLRSVQAGGRTEGIASVSYQKEQEYRNEQLHVGREKQMSLAGLRPHCFKEGSGYYMTSYFIWSLPDTQRWIGTDSVTGIDSLYIPYFTVQCRALQGRWYWATKKGGLRYELK